MAITVLSKTVPYQVQSGQQGFFRQTFTCAWSTTDTTGTIPSGMKKVLRYVGCGILTASAIANDQVNVANTLNADGSLVLGTGATISLERPAGTTSACKFTVTFEGYI